MSHIFIEVITSYSDCDDCGISSSTGAIVYIDDKEVIDLEAVAACYGSVSYGQPEVFWDILKHLEIQQVQPDTGVYPYGEGEFRKLLEDHGHSLSIVYVDEDMDEIYFDEEGEEFPEEPVAW